MAPSLRLNAEIPKAKLRPYIHTLNHGQVSSHLSSFGRDGVHPRCASKPDTLLLCNVAGRLLHLLYAGSRLIPKGACVGVSSHALWDPEVYPEPEKWDGYWFYRLREEPGKENFAQLVSTAPGHLGFGHGRHACPGGFFAANEIKIVLAHILLHPIMNPHLEIEIQRRADEVDLEKFREQPV
ncbi:Cytochrome P450 monooxygenase pyr3 [Colletotrichum shisoi]|uniref:Cytochrome P450 monooxygenase pyr3 n=1 Tax=Colletotrichum shisoi TaxID=2078593 RepID=A0A5Q4BDB2_9PEZI|nr:Cytochrome P450 monooxygenase pyr3 [Colletotrichum shisoi]